VSSGASTRDPELGKLLLDELRRHAPALAPGASPAQQRYVLHALKGSAGIAGERGLGDAIARIERRIVAGDAEAIVDARALLALAEQALATGSVIPLPVWPEPPDDLRVTPIDPQQAPHYIAEMQDRIERVDRALAAEGPDAQASLAAFREVHAMKGAALAVADEVTAWFCHGLEERLREGERSEEAGRRALAELARWRGVLAELIVAPERGLDTLRTLARPRLPSRSPLVDPLPLPPRAPSLPPAASPLPLPPRRPSMEPPPISEAEPRSQVEGEPTLRVSTATLDRLFERVRQFGQARSQVSDGAELVRGTARRARVLRAALGEALRLIGPPRPWGAPAAAIKRIEDAAREIQGFSEQLERESLELKETADRVRVESAAAHDDLAAMRTTTVSWLFDRVAAAVSAEARREGRELRLVSAGEQAAIDRRVAEMLFDPILQLARNAVAHGIEPAPERALRGKPRVGTIQLSAQPRSGGLRLVVQDDGAGVDVADVRLRAVARGTISAEMARAADDQTLLALLFVPGFTTKDSADLLAGRGVGLDLALEAVHRLGGTIRLASQSGVGVTATLDIPFEPGLIKVLWLEAGGATYALPLQRARRILLGRDPAARGAIPLALCVRGLGAPAADTAPASRSGSRFAIELEPLRDDGPAPVLGVDRVGRIEEVALRGVSALIANAGPYAGAIVRGSELRLCLDAHGLAERIGAMPSGI
jgi:HPt (histidine-containing phosphotransfer) domain-containing protein/two-component sensor histidine kinase